MEDKKSNKEFEEEDTLDIDELELD